MQQIIIYHINDSHARISTHDENESSIGFDQMSKVINLSLLKNKNTFWFCGGDLFHGTPRVNISQGENLVDLLNYMNFNAICPGNHEFNFGTDQLCKLSKQLNSYILSANTVHKDNQYPVFLPYIIYNIDLNQNDYISENSNDSKQDNIKVGIFGLSTPETAYKTHPENVKNIQFLNPIESAKKIVNLLKNNCDIIIALTHLGLDESSEFTSKKLAKEIEGINIIIDAHSHTVLEHGLKINNTLIVQAGAHNQYLGKAIIDIKDKRINNIEATLLNENQVNEIINNSTDTFIENKIDFIEQEANRILNKPIFFNKRKLSGDRLLVRRQESELGNFTADACKYATNADFCIVNSGDIRTDLLEGDITYKDILAIYPFQNKINVYKISGKLIKEMLEHSVEFVPESFGGFLSVSANIKFSFIPNNESRNRIKEIYINNELIDYDKIYTIGMSSFIAAGGDDYQMLKGLKKINEFDTVENIVIKYIKEVGINKEAYQLGRIIKL